MFFATSPSHALEARLEALASSGAHRLLETYYAHLDERSLDHRDLHRAAAGQVPTSEPERASEASSNGARRGRKP